MTINLAYRRLLAQLYEVYDNREAATIADMVVEHVTGQRKIERIVYKELPINEEQQKQLERIADELLTHRPIQYVLGEAWFMDMKLMVNEHVLVPRPETEELVQWILDDITTGNKNLSVIDIGTGSGCIPIALKKKIPEIKVSAVDVSNEALQVAKFNSTELNADIDFIQTDFLEDKLWDQFGKYDVIVSNPPYIKKSEEAAMKDNVRKYEPAIALFVADEDPLLFYYAIARFARNHLNPSGSIYVEINEAMGKEVTGLFKSYRFTDVQLKQDMQGKDRMMKASFPAFAA